MKSRHSFRSSLFAHSRSRLDHSPDLVARADTSSSSLSTSTSISDSSSSSLSPESEASRAHQLLVTGLVLGFIALIIIGIILLWTKRMNLGSRRKYMERLDDPRRAVTPIPATPATPAQKDFTSSTKRSSPSAFSSSSDPEDEKREGANLKKSLSVSAKGLLRSASTSSSNLLRSASSSSTNLLRSKSKLNPNTLAAQITPFSLSATYGLTSSSQINLHSSPNGGLGTGDYAADTGGTNGYGEGPRFVHTPGQNMRIATRLENGVWVFSDPKRRRGGLGTLNNDSSTSLGTFPGRGGGGGGSNTAGGRSRSGSLTLTPTALGPTTTSSNSLGLDPEGSDPFSSPTSENSHNPFADPLAGLPPARPRPPKKSPSGQSGNSVYQRSMYANSLYSLYGGNRSANSIYDPYNPNSDFYEPSGVREADPAEIPRARPRPANTLLQLQRERNSRHLPQLQHSNIPGSHVLSGGVIPGSPISGAPYGYGEGSVEDGHGAWTDAGTEVFSEEPFEGDGFSQGGHSDAHSLQTSTIAREARLREEIEKYRRGEAGWGSDAGHGTRLGGGGVGGQVKEDGKMHEEEPLTPTNASVFTHTTESQYTAYAFALPSFENEPLGVRGEGRTGGGIEPPPPAYVSKDRERLRVDTRTQAYHHDLYSTSPGYTSTSMHSPISPSLMSSRTPVTANSSTTAMPRTPSSALTPTSATLPIPLSPHLKVGLKRTPSKARVPMSISEVDLVLKEGRWNEEEIGWAVR
ncbi:hypothetical protein K435DRAFT_876361 [Dendrothele bispora CBS 962.96]|uniref:Uncharacterized protein n=1 Tax=Dendrothele bispora (strain CBS 962.96) TaxID=1314807 RepID=A0A4V4HBA5_DENBC|nr:hypothetical protein K435DRAFT_876361 [Dendrothele bispora CBS 962.96]